MTNLEDKSTFAMLSDRGERRSDEQKKDKCLVEGMCFTSKHGCGPTDVSIHDKTEKHLRLICISAS